MRRHLVLVGLPGSGKTTVGRLAAAALAADFADLDEIIEREQGVSVSEIFARHGEVEFRMLEGEVAKRAIEGKAVVLAPGGGWAAQPGNLEIARGRCCLVYLRTSPEEAARRVASSGSRPLLGGGDAVQPMRRLLAEREGFYRRADATVSTDGQRPEVVAEQVVALARSRAGW